ncbi:MAG: ABC transporter ATP-binding protein [Gemmatimonadaceae bacterium]|nr:ABC transporter ATP-binding protein [Gemmatimonadaceae bacterium]
MISAEALSARVGEFELRDVSFVVPEGKYGVVIGAAGSGKTTLLETVAGIIPLNGGVLKLGGLDMKGVPPEGRNAGIVYQHGFLFPHLSVRENVRYGARDVAFADAIAERVGASELYAREVRGLSGGERQVVAIARALAPRPGVLLLDEPFSALDPRRRTLVRREVRAIARQLGITVLQVTHDFTEAGLLGDVAILIDAGRVLQSGPPERLFREPASPYIAEFLGAENVYAGEVRYLDDTAPDFVGEARELLARGHCAIEFLSGGLRLYTVGDAPAGEGHAVIRAEEVLISAQPQESSARNQFKGVVSEIATTGALTRVTVEIGGERGGKSAPIIAALTTRSAQELALREGSEVWASWKAMAVHLC